MSDPLYIFNRSQSEIVVESLLASSNLRSSMPTQQIQSLRVFVATWNVGGKSPHSGLNLDALLHVHSEFDVYVLGFQEIVPLNAGNVLVLGDNEPAAKWLAMINQSLNKSSSSSGGRLSPKTPSFGAGSMFFAKPSLKKISESFRTECRRKLKICNCSTFSEDIVRKYGRESCFRCPEGLVNQSGVLSDDEEDEDDDDDDEDEDEGGGKVASLVSNQMTMKYGLVASKQMVGIFLTVWMRKELIQHVSHLRISSVTRGIMGCLGNKGCIAVSLQLYKTSFCFICSHLASGEREGDERRRNLDVIEILKNTSFPRICRTSFTRVPDRITKHDRVIWLGDLNYRIALSYSETKTLLDKNAWDTLLNKDQVSQSVPFLPRNQVLVLITNSNKKKLNRFIGSETNYSSRLKETQVECSKDGMKEKSSLHQLISTLITLMLTRETLAKKRRTREELRPGAIGFFGTVMESGSSRTCAASHVSPIIGRFAPCLSSTLRFARVKPELGDNNLHQLLKNVLVELRYNLYIYYDTTTSGALEPARVFTLTLCCEKGEH